MTSVRDLLDVAAAELDGLSCRITLGEGPPPRQMAEGWTLLLPAAQHLIRQTVGPYTKVHRLSLRELGLLKAPTNSSPATAPAAIVRAGRALGGAGDLLATTLGHTAAAERISLLGEATRLLIASAEVTLHGMGSDFEHSATMISAADAGGLAHRLGRSARSDLSVTFRVLEDVAVRAPALPLTHPLGRLAQVVHEWVPMAASVVDRPAPSSHDLRGVALVAGQLTVAVRFLLALGPPDATSPTDRLVDAYGRAWSEAARQWTRYTLPGAPDPDLPAISWQVSTDLQDAFMRNGRWTSATAAAQSLTPASAARLRESITQGLGHVADVHCEAVLHAAQTGRLATHASATSRTMDRLSSSGTRWRPARSDDLHPLVSAYGRVARLMPRDVSSVAVVGAGIEGSATSPRHMIEPRSGLPLSTARPPKRSPSMTRGSADVKQGVHP